MKISFCERFMPNFVWKNKSSRTRIKTFSLVKDYVKRQICLKNIIAKLNELEKLKHTTMSEEQLAFFNRIDNPQSNFVRKVRYELNRGSIWAIGNPKDDPVEILYKKQKQKLKPLEGQEAPENEVISRNLLRLSEWIYDLK
jgi:hypothetical protein